MSDLNEEKNKELDAAGDITEEDTTAAQTNSDDNNAEPETAAAQEVSEEKTEPAEKPVKLKKPGKKPEEIRNGNPAARKLKLNKRNFKHGTLAVVFTVIFLAAVVVLNVIVSMISDRIDTTADLSDTGIYTLDDETIAYLDDLTMDVTVSVMNSETDFEGGGTYYKSVNELLKKMEMHNGHFKVQYLKIDQNPDFTSRFNGETLNTNYIVVEAEETGRHRIITPGSYFTCNALRNQFSQYGYPEAYIDQYVEQYVNSSYASQVIDGSNVEQAAISAMLYVTNTDPVRVAFTEGFGESDSSNLSNLLSKNGYDVETINLQSVAEIDSGIDYIVMFAPSMDYDNENLDKLAKFLDNDGAFGKNLIYFSNGQAYYNKTSEDSAALVNLSAFLAEWGIQIGDSYIMQTNPEYTYGNMAIAQVLDIQDTDYAGDVYGNSLFTYDGYVRPVIRIWGEDKSKSGIEQKVLIKTYDGAYLRPMSTLSDSEFDISSAESGVFNDAVCAYKIHSTSQEVSRVVAFGSELFPDVSYSNSNNQDFLVNMFNYISGKTEGVTITSKAFSMVGFDMNQGSANVLAVILCVVVPVVVIVLGIVIWVRRRHR
ncbi:MAG: GldG family protein [Oscillospiraceae bacterium]|nr:GldG family protein [Oscillospiraceae bacterium]